MLTLKQELENAEATHARVLNNYNVLIDKLKKKNEHEYGYEDHKKTFCRALSLLFNVVIDEYGFNTSYDIHQKTLWLDKNEKVSTNVYLVYKDFGRDFMTKENKLIGVVCYMEDIYVATEPYHHKLWLWYLNGNSRYNKSLEQFIEDCKSDKIKFMDKFRDYLNRDHKGYNNKFMGVINEPSIEVKDVFVYVNLDVYKNGQFC